VKPTDVMSRAVSQIDFIAVSPELHVVVPFCMTLKALGTIANEVPQESGALLDTRPLFQYSGATFMSKDKSFFPAVIAVLIGLGASAFALSSSSAQTATSQDPLFLRMEGRWTGQGTRTYPISGRTTQVSADVSSTVSVVNGQERLISDNQITETAEGATPQTYRSRYWIEAKPDQAGEYSLGVGQTSTSNGALLNDGDAAAFVSDQDLGNDYKIHSETQFNELGPLFTEITTNGNKVILKSVIQYRHSR
jgi:hypothetical protein